MIVPKKTFLNNNCKTGAVKTENISALTASFMKLATRYSVARPSIDHYIHVQVCGVCNIPEYHRVTIFIQGSLLPLES